MDETTYNSGDVAGEAAARSLAAPTDAELALAVRAGDEAAFEELFHRHRRRVALIAARFFAQREQIEEVAQETFAKAFFALGSYAETGENSFAAWLARIAFNVCYDELRRTQRRPERALDDLTEEDIAWLRRRVSDEAAGNDIESVAVSRDLAGKLLARLSPEDRLVLVLLDAEGLSVAEIAQITNWSRPKVKVRAHRARAALRRALRKYL